MQGKSGRILKAVVIAALAAALMLVLAGCMSNGRTDVSYNAETDGLTVTATNKSDAIATSAIDINDGFGICINPTLQHGTIGVTVVGTSFNDLVFEGEVSTEIVNVPVRGAVDPPDRFASGVTA